MPKRGQARYARSRSVACRELEAWFLGDLAAVEQGLQVNNVAREQERAKFQDPDHLGNPAQELKRLVPTYQKVSGARSIGPHLNTKLNRSTSFLNFIRGVRGLLAQEEPG